MRKMSEKDKREYDRITAHAEQMTLPLEKLTTRSKIYGYARVSTYGQAAHGNSLEEQKRQLRKAGAEEIFADVFTGKTTDSGHKWDDVWKSIYKGKREDDLDIDPNGYELMRTRRLRQYMEKLFEEEDT